MQPSSLGDQIVRVVKLLNAHRHQLPRLHPAVDPAAYPLLFALLGGPARPSEVASRIHSDISTVSRQASAFAQEGLIERLPDPVDGRAQLLSLTADGEHLLRIIRDHREAWLGRLLADWSEEDRCAFTALTRRFADAVEQQLPTHPHCPRPVSKDFA